MSNNDGQSAVAMFLHHQHDWVSSWEVAKHLRSLGIRSTTANGAVRDASADTASRFLSGLLKQGLVKKKRGKGIIDPNGVRQGPCTLWLLV